MNARRSKKRRVALWVMCSVPVLVAVYTAIAGIPEAHLRLRRSTIDAGGTMEARSERFTLRGTIGQHDAGSLSFRTLLLNGGFWFPLQPGDCEEDGDVDEREYARLSACLAGPAASVPRECECFDLNQDRHIELGDFSRMQLSYTGP